MDKGRIEFELKFTGPPAEIAGLPDSNFFAAIAPGGGAWMRLSSTYYDTANSMLAGKGLSLRLREEGADLIQAVKAKGPDAVSRLEYETPLARMDDFPADTGDKDIDRLVASCGEALAPFAKTTVDRWTAAVRFKGAEIELAVDLGKAEAWDENGRTYTGPLAEIELELLSGDEAAVFDLARLMIANAPLRFSAGTKLEAALALLPRASQIVAAERAHIGPETTAGDVLASLLCGVAARAAMLQGPLVDLRLPEGVHQMRVALRRLRAIERIYRRYLGSDEIAGLAARAKTYASLLGPARDWDVFIGETMPSVAEADYPPDGLRALKGAAETMRAEAWGRATAAVASPGFTGFLLDLMEAGRAQHWRAGARNILNLPAAAFAPKVLDRALRRALKTAAEVKGASNLAARHPLRIALKKLRYPMQLFRGLYPKARRKPYMVAMSALQDAFGAVNDAVEAQRLADRAAAESGKGMMRAAGFISGYKAAEAREAAKKIDAAFEAFEKMAPFWREKPD